MLARSCSMSLDLVRCLLWSTMIICWITIQGLWSIHFIYVPRWFSVCELLTVHWCDLDLLIQGSIRSTFSLLIFISFSVKDLLLVFICISFLFLDGSVYVSFLQFTDVVWICWFRGLLDPLFHFSFHII